jgi:hypothetical protein
MNEDERLKLEFELLLDEKKHADQTIASFMDLQTKIMAFTFSALAIVAGWVLSPGKSTDAALQDPQKAVALIIIVVISCFTLLLISTTYGISLGYIYVKNTYLSAQFKRVLSLNYKPLNTAAWKESPGSHVISIATAAIWFVIFALNIVLLAISWRLVHDCWEKAAVIGALVVVLVTGYVIWFTVNAMGKTEEKGA